jgi:ABC-2 type transport system ATP-binding protein
MGQLRNFCDQVAWLEHGLLKGVGPAGSVVDDYVDETHRDREVTETSAGATEARWGSGEVRIVEAQMLDRNGAETRTVRTGEPATIRMHYEASTEVAKPVFGIGITTLEGQDVTGPNTRDVEEVPDLLDGTGYVDFRVDRLTLLPGTYELTVAVYDYTCQHPIDHRHRLVRFDVVPGDPREGVGVMTLGGRWGYSDPQAGASARRAPTSRAEP